MATHQICPTCLLEQPEDREPIAYFAKSTLHLPQADDIANLYEDTHKVLYFLGALAQAAPCAIAQQAEGSQGQVDADYVMWLSWLAEELTNEAGRRLLRVQQAGLLWKDRAKEMEKQQALIPPGISFTQAYGEVKITVTGPHGELALFADGGKKGPALTIDDPEKEPGQLIKYKVVWCLEANGRLKGWWMDEEGKRQWIPAKPTTPRKTSGKVTRLPAKKKAA